MSKWVAPAAFATSQTTRTTRVRATFASVRSADWKGRQPCAVRGPLKGSDRRSRRVDDVEAANAFLKTLEEPPRERRAGAYRRAEERVPRDRALALPAGGVLRCSARRNRARTRRAMGSNAGAGRAVRPPVARKAWLGGSRCRRTKAPAWIASVRWPRSSRRWKAGSSSDSPMRRCSGARFSQDAATRVDASSCICGGLVARCARELRSAKIWWPISTRLDELTSHASQYGVAGALRLSAGGSGDAARLEENASPTLALEAMLLEMPAAPEAPLILERRRATRRRGDLSRAKQ